MSRKRAVHELFELTRVRVILFLREPEAIFWVFVFPVILVVVLGYAFREQEPEPSRIGVLERAGAAAVTAKLDGDDQVEVVGLDELEDARRQLRKGSIDALVVPGEPPLVRFDPKRTEGALARVRVLRAIGDRQAPSATTPAIREEPATERGSRYIDFLFAGILGMNLMGTGVWGIGFALAEMRQKKLLKRLMVTPMSRASLLASFVLSRFVFLVAEVAVLLCFGLFVLDVPMSGSALSFGLLCLVGAVSFAGLGLLLASRARTIEGISGIMNLTLMPMWLLSGIFFSYERFPDAAQPIIRILPLTALVDGLRAIMLDGESLFAQGFELAVLAAWAVLCFVAALRVFRWQ